MMSFRLIIACISVSLLYGVGVSAKYPSNLPKCKYGDTECIKNAINVILPMGGEGIKEINLLKLKPVARTSFNLTPDGPSADALKIDLTKVKIFGLDNLKINRVVGFDKDPNTSKFEIYFTTPLFVVLGDYEMAGKIIQIPIEGVGKANLTAINCENVLKFKAKTVEKNNNKYLEIKKMNYQTIPSRVYTHFTNLFGGDPVLGDTINKAMNDNWETIFGEMKRTVEKEVGNIFSLIINNVFASHSYSEFFDD